MKTRKNLNLFTRIISTMILLIILLSVTVNGDDSNGKYIRRDSQITKTQARAREVRGFRPGNLQTARDFGKRNDRFVELKDFHYDGHSRRYPSNWFYQRVQRYPRITKDLKTRLLLETMKFL